MYIEKHHISEILTLLVYVSPTDRENLPIYIFPRYIFLAHRNTALSLAEQKSFWARLKAGDEGF